MNLLLALGLVLASCAPAFAGPAAAPDLLQVQAQARRILADGDTSSPSLAPDDDGVAPTEALGNFHLVSPGLYRSAQPSKDGYAQLAQMKVKTILTLTGGADREREEAGAVGIKVESVPMASFSAPSFEEVDRALDVIATAQRPLLVHCTRGKDRTGFVIASYRMTVEKMDLDAAVAEAKSVGCCFVGFGDLGDFLRGYADHRRALKR